MMCLRPKIGASLMLAVFALLAVACTGDKYFEFNPEGRGSSYSRSTKSSGRVSPDLGRRVMLMVFGGRNSLYKYMVDDKAELEASDIPVGAYPTDHVLLILSRISNDYLHESPAALYRVYKGPNGDVIRDTIHVWGGFTPVFGESTLEEALEITKSEFPAAGYGIIMSSHGTGYLPNGYYANPSAYEDNGGSVIWSNSAPRRRVNIAMEEFEPLPEYPAVKSFGQDIDAGVSVEMELKKLKESIPYHLDYILMDACLMGGVETAYELKDKADYIGFSPTEVMADGFDYSTLASRLLKDTPDPVQVCKDYIGRYKSDGYPNPYATVSIVRTDKMDALAAVCKELFEKYRTQIANVNADRVQRYFRANYHFFYDLRDIFAKAGVSAEDLYKLDVAMNDCIVFKDCTPSFLSIPLNNYNGLSMYLPNMGSVFLDGFYEENIAWNAATELVK